MKTIPIQTRIVVPTFFFILFLCILTSVDKVRFDDLSKFGRRTFSSMSSHLSNSSSSTYFIASNSSNNDEIRILIGIFMIPDQYGHRHFLRMIYGMQSPVGAKVDVKFVFCNLTNEDQKVLVALEIIQYNDIIILDCIENMDKGKTYTYFSSLPGIFNDTNAPYPPYHYVMKGDDDTYTRLQHFVDSIIPLSREDLYYGYVVPCRSMDPFERNIYMAGWSYMISWDIVEWIRESPIPKNHMVGYEDRVFGDWMREGHKAKNRYNGKWSMYDFPEPRSGCSHELWPNTTLVHKLKTQDKWIRTLKYFNVTDNFKPSKLYHIP